MPRSILLVDDDPSHLQMLALHLRRAGLSVETAAGGERALELLRSRRFDFLVTDAEMVPVDGSALAREAGRLDPDMRVVMISGAAQEPLPEPARVERFFAKPLSLDLLIAHLAHPIEDGGIGRSLP